MYRQCKKLHQHKHRSQLPTQSWPKKSTGQYAFIPRGKVAILNESKSAKKFMARKKIYLTFIK